MTQNAKTYPMPDLAALAAKVKRLDGPVLNFTQATGSATVKGVDLHWTVAADRKTVSVAVWRKPFYVSYDMVFKQLDELLGGAA